MTSRWGFIAAMALGAALVAVPAGAATLITGKDIKNGTVTGKDLKNGTVKATDLAAALRRSPVTRYGASQTKAPAFSSTVAPTTGDTSVTIRTTRPGSLLVLASSPVNVQQDPAAPTAFTMQTALYLDRKAVPGTVQSIDSFSPCGDPDPECHKAINNPEIDGIVIPNVRAGTHTLTIRYFGTTTGTRSVTFPPFTVIELG